MKAFVTSIGETTTDLCKRSLERQGFEVQVVKGDDSLAAKLEYIYNEAKDDFVRVDADVIVNSNVKKLKAIGDEWWVSGSTYSWYKQDRTDGGVYYIRKEALPILRSRVAECIDEERPETYMWRLEEFFEPRRCIAKKMICGLQDYKQDDWERVMNTKIRRGQIEDYDFELARWIDEL